MFTDRLINEMGLLKLRPKNTSTSCDVKQPVKTVAVTNSEPNPTIQEQPIEAQIHNSMKEVKLDKNEFRLLVKMLQAIGHQCTYDNINYDGKTVTYQHPQKTLAFNDITLPDTDQNMNLSSLKDLLLDATLKRPVWEKLKTLTHQ